jgi:hypothetical protein
MKLTICNTKNLVNFVTDLPLLPAFNFLLEGYCHVLLKGKKAREWHYKKAELMVVNDEVAKLV